AWSTPTTPISRPSAIASGTWPTGQCRPDEQRLLVTTNVVITKNQSQTTCEEDKDNRWHASCKSDADCQKGHVHMLGWGVKTGRCVRSSREANLTICEIYGCLTHSSILTHLNPQVLMTHVKNFTVLIKNSVEFPKLPATTAEPPGGPVLPHLQVGWANIIKYGQAISEKAAKQIWITGGMVAIDIHWECNFDYDEEHCKPEYKFRNLEDGKVGQGWNFRHAYHYVEDGIHKRTLVKAFGIQFFISVTGRGGKFDILNFTMNLGSGLALLTLATVLCDIIVKRKEIERAKTIRESDRGGRRRGKRNRLGGATESAPGALGSASFTGHLSTPNSASLAVSGADLSDISACGGGGSSGGNNGIPFADAPTSPTSSAMLWPRPAPAAPRHGPRFVPATATSGVGDSRRLPGRPPAAVRPVRLGLRVDGIGRRGIEGRGGGQCGGQ
uniref:ATP receptor n=1 Tax=Macrostomum lignano TaxID=282301 RepID=A0A1I8F8P0_9PLAT